jgi:propionyl-CoA carboxylase beta chain
MREMVAEYRDKFANPYVAAARGMIDDVIRARTTRRKLIAALEMLKNKRRLHPSQEARQYSALNYQGRN